MGLAQAVLRNKVKGWQLAEHTLAVLDEPECTVNRPVLQAVPVATPGRAARKQRLGAKVQSQQTQQHKHKGPATAGPAARASQAPGKTRKHHGRNTTLVFMRLSPV
jgi:hypothetical protein